MLPPYPFRLASEKKVAAVRVGIGIPLHARLETDDLLSHLGLRAIALTEIAPDCIESAFALYTHVGRTPAFSAAAVCDPSDARALGIVYNDAHEVERQRADIAHECAHVLLGHDPAARIDATGEATYPEKEEAEAHWVGPALLVPRPGLLAVLRANSSLANAAQHFGVSVQLARMRFNLCGLKKLVRATD